MTAAFVKHSVCLMNNIVWCYILTRRAAAVDHTVGGWREGGQCSVLHHSVGISVVGG